MRLRAWIIVLFYLAPAVWAGGQTVNLTASNTKTLGGATFTGKLCMVPTNNNGVVIPFQYGGGGQGVTKQVCWSVTSGALQSGVTVPDTYLSNPQNLCLYTQLIDPTQPPQKQNVGTYPCLQPASSGQAWCSAGTCNLDNYAPSVTALVVQQTGVPGVQGVPGGLPGAVDVNTLAGADFGAKLTTCLSGLNATYGGICEARNLAGALTMASTVTISKPNTVINLPCATVTTAQQIIVAAGVRNVTIHGCAYQGGSNASGTQGGSVWVYTGSGAAIQVGDTTYAQDTKGFHIDNVNLNTASGGTSAMGLAFYRTQEIEARNLYLNGNQLAGQTGVYLDGTGNYSGGTFDADTLNGFGTGLYMTGHLSGSAVGDFANASTFTRIHMDCPTSSGAPITGTYGVNIVAGDGNTWSGGDIEGCSTMFHMGANAVNNTVTGLRNENSTIQYQADSGSSYNAVFTGGTLFTGQLIDNGSRNSFWDAFHRTVNGIKGDWFASQQDATIVNHMRLGTGTGTVRGMQWESQVDLGTSSSQYNWLWGLTDGAAGSSNWIYQDLINNVIRLQLGQLNTAGGNNATALNSAGTGNVCFNCSSNAGTGGVAFASGGATPTTVGTVDSSGNQTAYGYHRFYAAGAEAWRFNCASASACNIDSWTTGSGVHHLRMYNGSGTEIDSEGSAAVVINNTSTGGTGGLIVYEGGANSGVASLTVDGSGNSTVAHNLVIANHLNQTVTKDFAGTCAMSSGTSCTFSINSSYTSTPLCFANVQNSTAGAGSCVLSGTTVTIYAASSNSSTWAALLIGNPN